MIYFIAAVYNEESEIIDLLYHVLDMSIIEGVYIADDGSTDNTVRLMEAFDKNVGLINYEVLSHTGLPETVKHHAKEMVPDGSWILMLDADERLSDDARWGIQMFFDSGEAENYDYVYFDQYEIIDGNHVRSFQKCKLFRKEAISFPLNNIHADDVFEGRGVHKPEWVVIHRKTTNKQINREKEYLATYKRLLDEGHIDQGRYEWLKGLHHYVK